MMRVYLDEYDITSTVGSLTRSDSIDSLGERLDFTYVGDKIPMGSRVAVYDGELLYYGTVVQGSRSGAKEYNYSCYDDTYMLNKNQAFIQFNNISVKAAIAKLCDQYSIPVTINCELATMVDKIYDGQVISDIIKELLKTVTDETGEKFRMEYNQGNLLIDKYSNLVVFPYYRNGSTMVDATKVIGSLSAKESIENLCNKIVILSGTERNMHEEATVQDDASIDQYGQYTHYEKIDDKDIAQARNIADQKLKELNKIETEMSVTLLGDNQVRSGRCIYIENELYLVKSCKHTYNANTHEMELELCGLMT